MAMIKRILNLFIKYDYPKDIQRQFWQWLAEPSHSEQKDEALGLIWNSINSEVTQSTLNSLQEVECKLGLMDNKIQRKRSIFIRFMKIAAVLLFLILSGLYTYIHISDTDDSVKFTECFVSEGELKKVLLPDGSEVIINSGSIIIYPEVQKGKQRSVYLNGEAYFNVVHNPDLPFVVKTDGVDVEVLGTKFNISAYSNDPDITTTLEEGKVKLNFKNKELRSLDLSPNDKTIYNKNSGQLINSRVSGKYIAAWRDGLLLFTDANIHTVLRAFERKYGVSVYLNSDKYEDAKLTVKFIHGETLKESLHVLAKIIPGLRYELEKDKLFIY
ncbi:ferric-dicitrate binding protein FerR (iron transport regulator) [Dysgonomonas hofstadii]|uniref:Ferric-dicitrate binding protein FerR (Iron transport regulator) n=2 Tax=Dysgonomonas hofstadii TaxID=637886 RepID=A0A840CQ90_9BACT|nr:ferric-dicitrate binding protein FerR (iron transport regulator) [Dysgonomonas hofstadii]